MYIKEAASSRRSDGLDQIVNEPKRPVCGMTSKPPVTMNGSDDEPLPIGPRSADIQAEPRLLTWRDSCYPFPMQQTSPEAEAERRLIVALDMPDAAQAYDFWQRLAIPNAVCKIGLELLMAGGVELVRKLASSGVSVFVDAKLFDIANTVERATARVADLGAAFLTVHAQDRQTLEAAVRGRAGSSLNCSGSRFLQMRTRTI